MPTDQMTAMLAGIRYGLIATSFTGDIPEHLISSAINADENHTILGFYTKLINEVSHRPGSAIAFAGVNLSTDDWKAIISLVDKNGLKLTDDIANRRHVISSPQNREIIA